MNQHINPKEGVPTHTLFIVFTKQLTMRKNICTHILLSILLAVPATTFPQAYSFEDNRLPQDWKIDKGTLSITAGRYKSGKHSLRIGWQQEAVLTLGTPTGLSEACKAKNGGINAWIYNESPTKEHLIFSFKDKRGKEVCRLPFFLNFKGWRCIWAKFQNDMNMPAGSNIHNVELHFPHQQAKEGTTYIDLLEFTPNVSWQNMSDAQYNVNRTDFSLIPDFIGYRNATPQTDKVISASDTQIKEIADRLTAWYLGSNTRQPADKWVNLRTDNEKTFIRNGVAAAQKIKIQYNRDKTPKGEPLFPMGAPNVIEGETAAKFRTVNEKMLLPLALDYRKNNSRQSLEKALFIYDWFNDQGWADGSGMGTLCFEKLRSSGYFHSFFLLKEQLPADVLERELRTLNWFTMFGTCYQLPAHAGEVADNLRALAIPKLIYALSLTDKQQRQTALTAFKNYMDNALGIAPGFFGTFKADFSGYHHRGPYHSAYYPHALYAGALVAYLLHDTPYALSATTMHNLKQGLLTFRFFCAGLDVPAGTVGRFPKGQQVLETLLPAFAYVALSGEEPDRELTAAFKQIIENNDYRQAITDYVCNVNSTLAYTSSVGEIELLSKLESTSIPKEKAVTGSRFMPYSGLLVAKDSLFHFNVKGFSRYIWDFESSATENTKGRYLAYGQIEYFDLQNKRKSFSPQEPDFQWSFIPGATTKVLPDNLLQDKGGASSGHRNFSDETFLSGVHTSGPNAMFSFRMHDITYDRSFRANKSVFVFEDYLLCLGSDIQTEDKRYPVVTTLFQSFGKNTSEKRTKEGTILTDASLMYAVKKGVVRTQHEGTHTCAYIEHGSPARNAQYHYYILKHKDKKLAGQLLSKNSPIEVIEQDNDAHIIRHKTKDIVCGALYNAQKTYPNLPVTQVNIPLAYIAEKQQDHSLKLSICEPDMRRASRAHMGLLTEEDVIQQEQAFASQLTIDGLYTAECPQKTIQVSHDKENHKTYISISTIRGENYTLLLHPINH